MQPEPQKGADGSFAAFYQQGAALAVLLGNVLGSSAEVSRLANRLRRELAHLDPLEEPERLMVLLDLCARNGSRETAPVSVLLALVDLDQATLLLYNAGHPAPLLFSGDTAECIPPMSGPLGWGRGPEGGPILRSFEPYDTLLLPGGDGAVNGGQRFSQHLRLLMQCAAAETASDFERCVDGMRSEDRAPADPPACIVIRRRPVPLGLLKT